MAKRKARVKYEEQNGREGFAIYITAGKDWNLDTWFPCVAKIGADKVGAENETDYIHWRFIEKLAHIQNLGYSIEFD